MNTTRYVAALISLTVLGATTPAMGGGLALAEHSAAAMGMAGAVTAVANSPAAGFFNPAGLATQTGLGIEGTFTAFVASASYKGTPGTASEVEADGTLPFYLPAGHISYRIHDRVAAGFSFYFPYGLGAAWPETVDENGTEVPWWGRGTIQELSLYTMALNPNVAVKLHDRVYVGGGVSVMKGVVTLSRALTLTNNAADDIDFKISGEGWGVGGNAGVLVKVLPDVLNVGATYRSKVDLTLKGNAAFTRAGSADNVPDSLRTLAVDGPGEADLPLPHAISFGIAAWPIPDLTVGFGLDVLTWTSYERLNIRFPENPALTVSEPKAWENSITVRVGLEYKVLPYLPLRVGFIFDQGPMPAITRGPDTPDGDRYEVSAGIGYAIGGLHVDAAYMFYTTAENDTAPGAPLEGAYRLWFHIASLSVGYNLDI